MQYFGNKGSFSQMRFYLFVRDLYSGNLHAHQKKELVNKLGSSNSSVNRHIRNFVRDGLMVKRGKGWHLVNIRKFFDIGYRVTDAGKIIKGHKQYEIDFDILSDNALKKLRTMFIAFKAKDAHYLAMKNRRKFEKENGSLSKLSRLQRTSFKREKLINRLCAYEKLSASFVKNCGHIERHKSTISRHLIRAAKYGFLKVRKAKEYLLNDWGHTLHLPLRDALNLANQIFNDEGVYYKVRESKSYSNLFEKRYILQKNINEYAFDWEVFHLEHNVVDNLSAFSLIVDNINDGIEVV